MSFIKLWGLCSGLSLLIMLVIDYFLGSQAEVLNAWSVVERLLGRPSTAGDSIVYQKSGPAAEFLAVVCVNIFFGGLLSLLFTLISRGKSRWLNPDTH